MRLLLSLLLIGCSAVAEAQRLYYVYLQTDPVQPFFVKMGEQVIPAASSGFVVLPRLKDSTYQLRIGFPDNKTPEQRFQLQVKGNDMGFLVKDFGQKGWGLFNLQTLEVIAADQTPGLATRMEPREVSVFTDVLSKASNDPSLKMKPVAPVVVENPQEKKEAKPVAAIEPVQKDTVQSRDVATQDLKEEKPLSPVAEPARDTALTRAAPQVAPIKEEVKAEPVAEMKQEVRVEEKEVKPAPAEVKEEMRETPKLAEQHADESNWSRSVVARRSESSTTEGFGLTFTDTYGDGRVDTIRIIIPHPRPGLAVIETPAAPVQKEVVVKPKQELKNECKGQGTESDFLKLRKKMAAEDSDEGMISEARKVFRAKCFTTEHIRLLGGLFLKDGGRYQFFDLAYEHVSDAVNFPGLVGELKDPYYISRFNSMLR